MKKQKLFLICNVLALFTFYAVPSSGKRKCALVHCTGNFFYFKSPPPTLMAFTEVTNAHGPSPQPTGWRFPLCSLTVTTERNSQTLPKHWMGGANMSWPVLPIVI